MSKEQNLLRKVLTVIFEKWYFIWFLGCFAVLCLFMDKHITELLHSDFSSEMVFAKFLAGENKFISSNWNYSTELRVIQTQLVMMPLFKIFNDWHTIRVVGSIILFGVYLLSYYYFCRQARVKSTFAMSAAFLLLPYTDDYFEVVLYGICYIPYISMSLVMLGLIFQWLNCTKKRVRLALCGIIVIFSILIGMGGIRQLLVFYIPVVCVALICLLVHQEELRENWKENRWSRLLGISLVSSVAAGAGYLINSKILYRIYNFHSYEMLEYTEFSWAALGKTINGIMRNFGWRSGEGVFSLATICNLVCLLLLGLSIWILIKVIRKQIDYGEEIYITSIFCVVAMVILAAVYSLTYLGYEDRYSFPILIFLVPIVTIFLQSMIDRYAKVFHVLCIVIAMAVTFCSVLNYEKYSAIDKTEEMREMASFLQEEGYTKGYSLFWTGGNLLTELSNGEIEMWILADDSSENVENLEYIYPWLQEERHVYTKPEGTVFVLLPQWRARMYTIAQKMGSDHIIYESEKYIIWGYENYAELEAEVNN